MNYEKPLITLFEPVSKPKLSVYTTYPSVVVYSDNYPRTTPLKGDVKEVEHAAVTIETQYIPCDLPGIVLKKGMLYFHKTRYVIE